MASGRFQEPPETRRCQAVATQAFLDTLFRSQARLALSDVILLLQVYVKPGLGPTDYSKVLGETNNGSRQLLMLGSKNRKGEPGLGLVDHVVHEQDYRLKRVFLTPKGRVLVENFLKDVEKCSG